MLVLAVAALGAFSLVHVALDHSVPASGDRVSELEVIELTFTEDVDLAASGIRLVGDDGQQTDLEVTHPPDGSAVLVAQPPQGLPGGDYVIEWRTASADGHPIEGAIRFTLTSPTATEPTDAAVTGSPDLSDAEGQAPNPADDAAVGLDGDEVMEQSGEMEGMGEMNHPIRELPIFAALMRGAGVGLLAALTGLLMFGQWITPWTDERGLDRITRTLAILAPLGLAAHLTAWGLFAMDPIFGISATDMIFGTLPGKLELYRLGLAAIAAVAVLLKRRGIAAAFAFGAVLLTGMSGHAMSFSRELLVPARALHVGAVSLWLGGLMVLLWTAREGDAYRQTTERVSSIALGAVIVLLITGIAHLIVFPTDLRTLVFSLYGTVLIAKLVGVAILVGFGARNRLAVVPRLPDPGAIRTLRSNAAWEIAVMALVLIATGLLLYVSLPETGM